MAKSLRYTIDIEGTIEETRAMGQLQAEVDNLTRSLQQLRKVERDQGALTRSQSEERARLNTQLKATKNAYRDLEAEILKNNDALRKNSGFVEGIKKGINETIGTITKLTAAYLVVREAAQKVAEVNRAAIRIYNDDRKAAIVFGDSLGYVTEQSKKNANQIGLTAREYRSATAATQDLLVPLGFARGEAARFSTNLTNLSGALSLWDTKQRSSAEISGILTKALLGEAEQAKELGIVIDQSSKDYNTRIATLIRVQGVTKEQARAMDILQQIIQKTEDAQTNFANSTENMGLKQAQATARLREAGEELIEVLTPALNSATNATAAFIEQLTNAANQIKFVNNRVDTSGDAQRRFSALMKEDASGRAAIIRAAKEEIEVYKQLIEKRTADARAQTENNQAYEDAFTDVQEFKKRLEVEREFLALVAKNADAVLHFAKSQQSTQDSSVRQIGIIKQLTDEQKRLNEAITNATTIGEIRGYQKELEGVELRLKFLTNTAKEAELTMDELNAMFKESLAPESGSFFGDALSNERISQDAGSVADSLLPDEDGTDAALEAFLDKNKQASEELAELWDQAYMNIKAAAISNISQIVNAQFQAEQTKIEKSLQKEQELNKLLYDSEIISLQEYLSRKDQIEKEALREKKRSMRSQILANTALAIISALATVQPTVPAGVAAAGIAAGQGFVQLGVLEAQQFAKGGKFDGKSHDRGGIKGVLNGKPVEFEGDEMFIANKRLSKDKGKYRVIGSPEEIVSALNAMHGGDNWMPGGVVLRDRQVDESLYRKNTQPNSESVNVTVDDFNTVSELKETRKTLVKTNRELREAIEKQKSLYL